MRKIITVAFLALSFPAQAGVVDGNKLYQACTDDSTLLIHGYVLGVIDTISSPRMAWDKDGEVAITAVDVCFPEGVTVKQTVDLTCQYISDNPSFRHQDGDILVHSALYSAWSC